MFGQAAEWQTSVEVCASMALEWKSQHDASLATSMNIQHYGPRALRLHTMLHHQNVPRDLQLRSSVSCLFLEQVQRNVQEMNTNVVKAPAGWRAVITVWKKGSTWNVVKTTYF